MTCFLKFHVVKTYPPTSKQIVLRTELNTRWQGPPLFKIASYTLSSQRWKVEDTSLPYFHTATYLIINLWNSLYIYLTEKFGNLPNKYADNANSAQELDSWVTKKKKYQINKSPHWKFLPSTIWIAKGGEEETKITNKQKNNQKNKTTKKPPHTNKKTQTSVFINKLLVLIQNNKTLRVEQKHKAELIFILTYL